MNTKLLHVIPGAVVACSALGLWGVVARRLDDATVLLVVAATAGATGDGILELSAGPEGTRLVLDLWETRRLAESQCQCEGNLSRQELDTLLRALGCQSARGYYDAFHKKAPFVPDVSPAPVSGKCYGVEEMENLLEAGFDFWLTTGRFNDAFEERFAARVGRKFALSANSGSSANLLAVAALTSPKLGERRLRPGDEVITTAAGFPTTVAPLVQYGLIPVFLDADPATGNVRPEQIEAAVTDKTRLVCLAHTLGNPFDLAAAMKVVKAHDLWLIEDCCDALGAGFNRDGLSGLCGTFGHIATYSFYPAHHITMGEGGAVTTDDPLLRKLLMSYRDWGRDCWCPPGHDDTCKRRYAWKFPLLPEGYDHKYVYSHLGYNLKITDMQAAVGLAQLDRLDGFIEARRKNFAILTEALADLEGEHLSLPKPTPGSLPSWFGYLVTLGPAAGSREDLLRFLAGHKIGTRLLFAGNMLRQPCSEAMVHRVPVELVGTDVIMRRSFWIGLYPGLSREQLEFSAGCLRRWLTGGGN
jgi:CDP-4-dehydro-6-deoxyglucose reductase, E1